MCSSSDSLSDWKSWSSFPLWDLNPPSHSWSKRWCLDGTTLKHCRQPLANWVEKPCHVLLVPLVFQCFWGRPRWRAKDLAGTKHKFKLVHVSFGSTAMSHHGVEWCENEPIKQELPARFVNWAWTIQITHWHVWLPQPKNIKNLANWMNWKAPSFAAQRISKMLGLQHTCS